MTDQNKSKRDIALESLGIEKENKLILCLDGGGVRGILTIQLLKKIEEIADMACYELFDMVAGTSTGGIIAGLIAAKKRADEIESLYTDLVSKVFLKRKRYSGRILNLPKYSKKNYRALLYEHLNNQSLEEACNNSGIDLLVTSKDVSAGEETFFTCFNIEGSYQGTYKDVLLRSVLEATMSAPTYFYSLDQFVDGGTTTYNNPSLSALLEAVVYGGKTKYDINKLTLLSLGTGTTVKLCEPKKVMFPKRPRAYFWLTYVLSESGQDASDMQTYGLRSGLIKKIDFRRFQLSLDSEAVKKLPNINISKLKLKGVTRLHDLTDDILQGIDLDHVSKFQLLKEIGKSLVDYICPQNEDNLPLSQRTANWFRKDLITPNKRDQLVTTKGTQEYINSIKSKLSNPSFIDNLPK